MKLYTPVSVERQDFSLHYGNHIMLIGSCFTENMGLRLQSLRFPVLLNPFGILYNPLSMAEALERCLDNRPISSDDLVQHDGLWHSWLHHGAFSAVDKEECLRRCNKAILQAHTFLQQCDKLLLTFGSAWHFVHLPSGRVVGNCHKLPSANFQRQLASVEAIMARWQPLLRRLQQQHTEVLLTISPVRHWAYGAYGNQLGKASLFLAIDALCNEFKSFTYYFPAYEILMDELRDYRYYADDLLHPSFMAEELVWQRLQQAYMSEDTIALCNKVDKLNKLQSHRMLHASPEAVRQHQSRKAQLQQEVEKLLAAYNK